MEWGCNAQTVFFLASPEPSGEEADATRLKNHHVL